MRQRVRSKSSAETKQLRELEEKRTALAQTREGWRSLLAEMELEGQTSESSYLRYRNAYQETQRQHTQVELCIYNLKFGHVR